MSYWPLVQVGAAKQKISTRLWWGQATNADEAHEFYELLGLTGDQTAGVNPHASTLNTLIAQGRTKRTARTSTSYGDSVGARTISLSVLGNAHPSRIVSMDRRLIGNHTVASKERFIFVTDYAVARHDRLPPGSAPPTGRWTWLPLTDLQATVFWVGSLAEPPRVLQDCEWVPE